MHAKDIEVSIIYSGGGRFILINHQDCVCEGLNSTFHRISLFYGPCQCDARTISKHQSFIYGKVFFFFLFIFPSFPSIVAGKVHINCSLLIFFLTKALPHKVNNIKYFSKQNKSVWKIPLESCEISFTKFLSGLVFQEQ